MTPQPNSLAARDIAYTLHPYTHLAQHELQGPHVITRGEGITVWDDDGKSYIEGMAGLWCTGLGFSEPRLVEAAAAQLSTLPYMQTFAHRSTEPVIRYAEELIRIAPAPMAKAFFANSGSEAIDTAIKFAWYYQNGRDRPQKKKIISRRRAYHGVTIAGGSLTALPYAQTDFDLPLGDRFLHTEVPCYYRGAQPGEDETAFSRRLADSLEQLILREGADTVAAFFAEPVMGAGGVVPPPEGYFEQIQRVLRRHDVLLIADEVICGFGRTGNLWGCETYGIRPDMVTCAKQMTSAYFPMSAVMISDEIYRVFVEQSRKHQNFGTGFTYGGHPVAAAVALETLAIYRERDLLAHIRRVAPRFQQRLAGLAEHPLVGDARGVGLIGGVEIVADKATKSAFPQASKAALKVAAKAQQRGLLLRPLPSDTVGICPPLIIDEQQIDELFDRLHSALDGAVPELDEVRERAPQPQTV